MPDQPLPERMRELLTAQLDGYAEILELCREQQVCIDGRDNQALLELLSRKQGMIRNMDALTTDGAELLREWEAARSGYSASERAPLEELHARLVSVLSELTALEESGRRELESRLGAQGKKIASMQPGKQMLKAYGVKSAPAPRFTDKHT